MYPEKIKTRGCLAEAGFSTKFLLNSGLLEVKFFFFALELEVFKKSQKGISVLLTIGRSLFPHVFFPNHCPCYIAQGSD